MSEETKEQGFELALGAIAEVLNKMNNTANTQAEYLSKIVAKQDEEEEKKKKEDEMLEKQESFSNLVKAVVAEIKKEDSKESAKAISTKPDEQQKPIQAAEDGEDKKEEDEKKIEEQEEKEEEEDEKDKEFPEVEKLRKEIEALRKNQESMVEKGVDERLRKMGWAEAKGAVSPTRVALGADETTIAKSDSEEDRITKLSKLDYGTLVKMEMMSDAGELPPEIKQLIS